MFKATKYRVYPNAKQEILLSKHFGCVRNPTHKEKPFACLNLSAFTVDPNPCHLVPDGKYYTVSVGFGEDIEAVEGFLLSASTITPTINDKNHLQYSGQLGINTGINRGI